MRLVIDTNVIVSPLVNDEFAEDSLLFLKFTIFSWISIRFSVSEISGALCDVVPS